MMNKKIMYMAGVVLASLSLGAMTAQTVNAAITNPIRQGKKLNLTRKATIFNRKGEKVGHLKKGRVYKILGIKSINGNNFVKIGKNKFVKEGAFLPYIKDTAETINRIKHPSYVYDKNGQPIPGKFVKQGSKVKNLGHKEIDERPFIQIGENEYVKANNVLTVIINY